MSGSSINNRVFSPSTIEALSKKVDKNQDKNVLISELKSLDKNKNGNLDTKELNSIGITNTEDIKEIQSEFKNHKSDPNKVFFSSNKLNLNNFSEDQFKKYQNINSLLKNSPKLLSQFHELLRKYNSSTSIDRVLDRTIEKFSKVKNPKNIEFSKNECEGHNFGLDDANNILKTVKSQIKDIPNRHGMLNPKFYKGIPLFIERLSLGNPLKIDLTKNIEIKASPYLISKIGNPLNSKLVENIRSIDFIADYAIKLGAGNCLENACLSAVEASKYSGIDSIEIFQMPNLDAGHAFVVVNRNQESDSKKMSTWGDKAIIIDAWSGIVFKAKDYPSDIPNKKHPKFPKGDISYDISYK